MHGADRRRLHQRPLHLRDLVGQAVEVGAGDGAGAVAGRLAREAGEGRGEGGLGGGGSGEGVLLREEGQALGRGTAAVGRPLRVDLRRRKAAAAGGWDVRGPEGEGGRGCWSAGWCQVEPAQGPRRRGRGCG